MDGPEFIYPTTVAREPDAIGWAKVAEAEHAARPRNWVVRLFRWYWRLVSKHMGSPA